MNEKKERGNNVLFMNREFEKEINVRSRLRSKYWIQPSVKKKAVYENRKISTSK